ncbi:hypothetical protein QYE76_037928 [Lolium multiflorum]|uniref:SKP1 component dimerisation domain-containing protein n=1 Tax=Lolium multiflorum TaxID=4521 RepID=A0AAD8T6X0_LOLMU|nr:hypothetical protein QYE76_037927 [Lolium multiflorum]KAK1677080.1 hypothetical protein QYE76_037928 [Lolium multiflorum]
MTPGGAGGPGMRPPRGRVRVRARASAAAGVAGGGDASRGSSAIAARGREGGRSGWAEKERLRTSWGCQTVADMIKGKNLGEIRNTLSIKEE